MVNPQADLAERTGAFDDIADGHLRLMAKRVSRSMRAQGLQTLQFQAQTATSMSAMKKMKIRE